MVYRGGGPPREKEEWEAWFITADRFLSCARDNTESYYESSDILAKHSVELAFKGLIISKLGHLPSQYTKGRLGHDILELMKTVIKKGWMSQDELPVIAVEDIAYTDFASEGRQFVDCLSGMIAHEKYPHEGIAPHEFMTQEEVEDLIEKCQEVIDILHEHARD